MGQLRNRMQADLKIGGYSLATQKVYLYYAKRYAAHFMCSPERMGADEIRRFLMHLITVRGLAPSSIGQARAALRFLYGVTLRRPEEVVWVPSPKQAKKLPVVLAPEEIERLLVAVPNAKYRGVLMTMYAAGLRIGEAVTLRVDDIDSKRGAIRVRKGKGNVERYTILSRRLLEFLRTYWRSHNVGRDYLFPNVNGVNHVARETIQRAFRKARLAAGVREDATPHSLRHSFATHVHEAGVDIAVIRALLGHKDIRTTQLYTQVSLKTIGAVQSPFESLAELDPNVLG